MKLSLASPAIALQFLRKAAVIKVCACRKLQFSVLIWPSKLFILANYLQDSLCSSFTSPIHTSHKFTFTKMCGKMYFI